MVAMTPFKDAIATDVRKGAKSGGKSKSSSKGKRNY